MKKNVVYIRNDQKFVKIGFLTRALIRRCCNTVLDVEHFNEKAEISVLLVDNEKIKILNQKHRGKNEATDVLSFPLKGEFGHEIGENGLVALGDVVISVQMAKTQAEKFNHSFKREIAFLIVHSILHLLGYDHENGKVACEIMRNKEKLILMKLNIGRNKQKRSFKLF